MDTQMADNGKQVLTEIRNIIATNNIDDQTYRRLSLAIQADTSDRLTAIETVLNMKADVQHTHPDIEMLKKRDWYGLITSIAVAVVAGASSWFKK